MNAHNAGLLKEIYMEKINEEMQNCNDISLLDLLYKILYKSNAEA